MAKNKAKTGGKHRNTPKKGPKTPPQSRNNGDSPAFQLRDAARNSENRSDIWAANFRQQPMNFVAAQVVSERTDDNVSDSMQQEDKKTFPSLDGISESLDQATLPVTNPMTLNDSSSKRKIEIHRDNSPLPSKRRSLSRSTSSSDEDVVLFAGRRQIKNHVSEPQSTPSVELPFDNITSNLTTVPPDDKLEPLTKNENLENKTTIPKPPATVRKGKAQKKNKKKSLFVDSDDDLDAAMIADYVENVRENDEFEAAFEKGEEAIIGEWGKSDIEDLQDLSTSDEILDGIEAILSKRERPGGLQYLVVWEGYTADDARWIPHSSLTMDGAAEFIHSFEEEEKLIKEYPASTDQDSSDDDDDDPWRDTAGDSESDGDDNVPSEDERDLAERKKVRMADEHLARLLAKQEELGLGTDELVLRDGHDGGELEDLLDEELDFIPLGPSNRRPRKNNARSRRNKPVPIDDMLDPGDDYGDFDIMDLDRSSLKPRDPIADWALSDSDLEATLRSQYLNDRKTKSAKKAEREALRAQGLLGRKARTTGVPDINARYPDGMNMSQLRETLDDFLSSDRSSCSLPPMDKALRKLVHEIALGFNLNSKSLGTGLKRFPVLNRTRRTLPFDDDLWDRLSRKLGRRYLPRMDAPTSKGKAAARGRGGPTRARGGGDGGSGYREGEVVGAAAPELGIENRGRAMLEKMGWSQGTALGALNNKGIMAPIQHVVKMSRAGLG